MIEDFYYRVYDFKKYGTIKVFLVWREEFILTGMERERNSKSRTREIFWLAMVVITALTALGIRLFSSQGLGKAKKVSPTPLPSLVNGVDSSPEDAQDTTSTQITMPRDGQPSQQEILFQNISGFPASGTLYFQESYGTSTYSVRANLPDIIQAYEYGVWILSEEDNIYHRIGKMEKNKVGEYTFQKNVARDENRYSKIIVALEFIHSTSTPGRTILEAKIP